MFRPIAVATTEAKRLPMLFARNNNGSTNLFSRPKSSTIVPKLDAPIISQMVSNMLSIPPRESKASICSIPEFSWKPDAIAVQVALIANRKEDASESVIKRAMACGCINAVMTPAKIAEQIMASGAGTLNSDKPSKKTNGNKFHGVILNNSSKRVSSLLVMVLS